MNYTQQYNQEFDRIWGLLPEKAKIKANWFANFDTEKWLEITINEDLVDQKALTLAKLFRAKNEKGEWFLKEGGNENPTFLKLKESIKENQLLSNGYYTGQVIVAEVYLVNGILPPAQTLRDLFRKNCIPANDPEQDKTQIENLKLIEW